MRHFLLLTFGFILIFYPVASHASLLEFFFPSLKKEEYDPAKNMIAPFAVGQGAEEKEKLNSLPVDAIEMSKPHRTSKEIGQWAMTVATEVMNFEAGKFDEQLKTRDHLFDAVGKNQYLEFLRDKKVLSVAKDGRFNVVSYANAQPLLLNEGNVNNRYRWLFRIPVVVTYMDKNMKSYKGADAKLIQEAVLNVQVGRTRAKTKPDGLQVEQWSGKIKPMKIVEDTMP